MTQSHSGFRSLAAWQKSQDLGVRVIEELRKLPREQGAASLSGQLVRSVGSISANIAEGYGRYSEGAYRNHLSIARGSLFETESWTELMLRTGYLSFETRNEIIGLCGQVGRLLTTMMKDIQQPGQRRLKEESAIYLTDIDDAETQDE